MPRGMAESLKAKGIGVEHTLWSACRSDQTSADAKIGGDWHGAFTYYFCQNINKSQNNLVRDKLLEKVREDLKKGLFTQIPQLDTTATRKSLSAGFSRGAIPTMA